MFKNLKIPESSGPFLWSIHIRVKCPQSVKSLTNLIIYSQQMPTDDLRLMKLEVYSWAHHKHALCFPIQISFIEKKKKEKSLTDATTRAATLPAIMLISVKFQEF